MSFEKASSLQRKEKNAGHTRKEDKEIAEKEDLAARQRGQIFLAPQARGLF